MAGVTLRSLSCVEDEEALREIVTEYLRPIVAGMAEHFDVPRGLEDFVAATMANLDAYLPPKGRTILAETEDGALVGCGFLKRIRPDAVEMKRLYVRPALRGTGLGGRLIDRLMDEAREMGARWLYLDTGAHMTDVQAIYLHLGFEHVAPYPESENGPDMAPYFAFMRFDLG
ncbi:GNAT family N-acetyltransferase [Anianabacter salinae]|uniref:GNAT family N-acetyltransferase n=1 Tax=Anianabacter salinae TaxID=2851023 RepID=UPI00225E1E77|nr:GNAT family N-acetyltransferase [Anianabacter salinae]MBV0913909.1 GNAT family N-acetyltransferase [Anianabacter salinae]